MEVSVYLLLCVSIDILDDAYIAILWDRKDGK